MSNQTTESYAQAAAMSVLVVGCVSIRLSCLIVHFLHACCINTITYYAKVITFNGENLYKITDNQK